ncbi:hypothetical protein [Actinomadura algeriensis]|uniref:4-amino-4-deoxy-L-arabinose transferase-like glycosyltransferase n=1 Tax=Actinomadura algeriensis TaxID=1679523 RepID=A0ABR9JWY9_9ACTN|nr:hypothetical protein [Actinomadura algeriensis]MBE1535089.1 hypothetical protein [Actinomadura algeriensis]
MASTIDLRPSAPPAPQRDGRQRRRALPWLLVFGFLSQVSVRMWFARGRTGPAANPDETGYLVAARWLAGGPGGDLSGHTFYQGGYPLLLTPAYWFSHDPVTVYTIVMLINAVAGAALFPLGYAAARRFGLARRAALPVSFGAALLPASAFFGAFALTDAVLPALVLGWLLALDRFARRGRLPDAVLGSAIVAYAATVHTRGTVLLAVHLAALLVLRRGPRGTLAGLAVAVAGCALGAAGNARLRAALYPDGALDLGGLLVTRLTTLDGQAWALSGAAGQLWYLVVSTWGLAGAGLAAVAAVLLRRRTPPAERVMAGVLLATVCGIAYAASAALPDEHRVGNFAYGRYLACTALVLALAGAAALGRPRSRIRASAGALVILAGTGAWVVAYAGERLRTHEFIGFDFPEVMFLTRDRAALDLPEAALAAAGALGVLLVLARLPRPAVLTGLALAGTNLAALVFLFGPSPERARPAPVLPGPAAGGVVADRSLHWAIKVRLRYPVWWTRVGSFDVRTGRPPAPDVCTVVVPRPDGTAAADTWPAHPTGWRPRPGAAHGIGWTSWHDPSCGRRPGLRSG